MRDMSIIEKLQKLEVKGSKFGTERTRALLDILGKPDLQLKIIHIAGTNGKGSTAFYISRILSAAGKRFGSFTSPAVYSFAGQFSIDGHAVKTEKLEKYLNMAYEAGREYGDPPAAFEIETAAALKMFAGEGCEYAVLECGLGGRDDATNAVARKEVAVITSVSLEHTAVLGGTVEQICSAKSGIIKNCPAVVSALQCGEGKAFFKKLNVKFAGENLKLIQRSDYGQVFELDGVQYPLAMLGDEQCYNAATAIEACRILGIDAAIYADGVFKGVRLAGRMEIIGRGGATYVLDGSHNPASFSPLVGYLERRGGGDTLIYGCLSDKDVTAAADLLAPHFKNVICVRPESYRAMDIKRITEAFKGRGIRVGRAAGVGEALDAATGGLIVVCGSFTILKEAKEWIEREQ